MIRGTNTQFKFKLPYPKEELMWVTIKFWQPRNTNMYSSIMKNLEHCDSPQGSTDLYVSLTADETMRFSEKYKGEVQLRGQHKYSGTIFGNISALFTVYPMDDDMIDKDPMMPIENEDGWIIFDGDTIADK